MVYNGLSIHIARLHSQSRTGGGGGGLYTRGGVFVGHYGTCIKEPHVIDVSKLRMILLYTAIIQLIHSTDVR